MVELSVTSFMLMCWLAIIMICLEGATILSHSWVMYIFMLLSTVSVGCLIFSVWRD
jgi:hypothetical protein